MSRTTFAPKESYTGTGTLASYGFSFPIDRLEDLLIIEVDDNNDETQRVLGTDLTYLSSVTFDSVNGGGTVNLAANLPSGYRIILLQANDAPTQPSLFRNKGSFTLRRIEDALDFVMNALQRNTFKNKQALKIHESDDESTIVNILPPNFAGNPGRYVRINDAGNGWVYGVSEADLAAGSIPAGGVEGAVLGKLSATDGDVDWLPFAYTGFSSRFGIPWLSTNLNDTLTQILDLSYVGPSVSLSASGSGTVREKGNSVASTTLTAAVTQTVDPISRIQFFRDGLSIDDNNPPGNTGSGNTIFNETNPFSDNVTFRVDVTDDGTSGGPTTNSSSRSFTFVYPYYYGSNVPAITAAQVALLSKDIVTENTNFNRPFTPSNGDVYYFAYPASYGTLSSILDENGFETIGDWTLRVENITGLDTNAVSYNIYEFNNPVIAGSTDYTFIQ